MQHKLLASMQETDDMEEIYVQKARFESFDLELKVTQEKVDKVTKLGNQLIANRHPDSDKVRARIQHMLDLWAALQGSADTKRSKLNVCHQVCICVELYRMKSAQY